MKIIRPIDLTQADVFSSNAPMDQAPEWEAIGREFALDFAFMTAHAEGDTLAVADTGVGGAGDDKLRVYQLSTGNRILIQAEVWGRLYEVRVSPDEQYLLLRGTVVGATGLVHLYDLSTGNRIFSKTDWLGTNPSNPPVKSKLRWLRDSSRFFYIDTVSQSGDGPWFENTRSYKRFVSVDPATGNEFRLSPYSILRQPPVRGSGSGISEWNYNVDILEYEVTASGFIFCVLTDRHIDSSDRRISTARINASTGAGGYFVSEFAAASGSYPLNGFVVCPNPDRDQVVMCYATSSFREIVILEDNATLAVASVNPFSSLYDGTIVTGIYYGAAQQELVFSKTTGTRHRRFSALDLSDAGDLDSIIGQMPAFVFMSDNYYVYFRDTGGYGLVDSVTDEVITQTNPLVTEGDTYIYAQAVYRALSDNNDRPDLGVKSSPPTWADLGFINPLRMVDGKVGSLTQSPSPLVIEITSPDLVDGVAMFGLEANTVQAELLDGETVLFDTGEESLRDSSMINGWYSHFFTRRGVRKDFVLTSLPPYRGATLRITIASTDEVVRLGQIVAGQVINLGDLLFGSEFGIDDWSSKKRNVFGEFEIIERGFSKRGDYSVSMRTNQLSWIQQLLSGFRSKAIVYIGSESQRLSIIYGFFVVLRLVTEGPVYSQCRIEVEGLTDDSPTN